MIQTQDFIRHLYTAESRRVLASLIRLLKDFDLAEEALHEAFAAALAQWPSEGIPQNPRAWLVSTGRFKAIDQIRKRQRQMARREQEAQLLSIDDESIDANDTGILDDDPLRLIFICCHPSLSPEAQLALTLREVCGLTTEAIARAFLLSPSTLAQRIVRAKQKIRDAKIPYEIPSEAELPERLSSVLRVIYLLFNEGYASARGDNLLQNELSAEAIRLARCLVELLPHPEAIGLLALLLLQDSRRDARIDADGDLIRLEDQDRQRWLQHQIREGSLLVEQALRAGGAGVYSLQAAIAAVHAQAPSYLSTDWPEILGLYDVLLRLNPSPVIALNRAVAVAEVQGVAAALDELSRLENDLKDYYLFHAARADLHRRQGNKSAAQQDYEQALGLTESAPEQRFLSRQLATL